VHNTATVLLEHASMLGIGVAMVASLADYHRLVSLHRPLGIPHPDCGGDSPRESALLDPASVSRRHHVVPGGPWAGGAPFLALDTAV
jgi:hypothetical protein